MKGEHYVWSENGSEKQAKNQVLTQICEQCEKLLYEHIADAENNHLVFHYTSAEGFYNIITNKKLFFTDVAFLNDSTETVNIITTFQKTLEEEKENFTAEYYQYLMKLMELGDFDPMVFGGEGNKAVEDFDRYFVLACSFEGDSLNMWNYYAKDRDNDGGYNIAFDKSELIQSLIDFNAANYQGDLKLFYGKIIYNEKEKKQLIYEYLQGLNAAWEAAQNGQEKKDLMQTVKNSIRRLSIFFKHECFAIEKEYRFVVALPYQKLISYTEARQPHDEKLYKTRLINNMFTPYIKLKFLPDGIKAVCMSPLCEKYTTDYQLRNDLLTLRRTEKGKDVLQYGVHQFLRVNGYRLAENRIRRSEIPLRF